MRARGADMTRRILARDSGVSERYLAQLEAGQGNISVLLLRQIGAALSIPLNDLLAKRTTTGGADADPAVPAAAAETAACAHSRASCMRDFGSPPADRGSALR